MVTETPDLSQFSDTIKSVPALAAELRLSPERLARFASHVPSLRGTATRTLIIRLRLTESPLLLWAIHCELDRRGVAPCVRWPANVESSQMEFVTLLADLRWLALRASGQKGYARGWRDVFLQPVGSPRWHASIHRQHLFVTARQSLSHALARGLALSDTQRLDLMLTPTSAMASDRRKLTDESVSQLRAALLSVAQQRPDKAGIHDPASVAERRLQLWRTSVLAGRSPTRTALHWEALTGERISRQAVSHLVSEAERVRSQWGLQ